MTSRERIEAALRHEETDSIPLDMGSTGITGIAASTLSKLRLALGLDKAGDRVKVIEPYQLLGEVTDDLREALGIDTVGASGSGTIFGFENRDWKEWELPDGTPVLVPGAFNTEPEENGDVLMYPQGDKSAPASGRLPAGGYYFDAIVRQDPIVEAELDARDNLEEFTLIDNEGVEQIARDVERLYTETDYAVVGGFAATSFGDIAMVPALQLKHPKGIRDVEEWYMSTVLRRDYVYEVFEGQCEIALKNLARIAPRIGYRAAVCVVTGTDFGTQRGPFLSVETYRELYKPFHTRVNAWIHKNTPWKTFIHTCGGNRPLIDDYIDAGFDILNPVQTSAEGMDAKELKCEYGDRITFWGGGVDTQKTLPFGTPEEVRAEVLERCEIFAPGGGFVFNTIHNIQPNTPAENVVAMFEALNDFAS